MGPTYSRATGTPVLDFGHIYFYIRVQCSPDNLTLANLHAPLNLHACFGHNSLLLIKM